MASKREDITVLVVDNDIPTLYIVASLLRSWTYKVVTVDNGYDAMAALRKYRVYFDLVITNLHMPGMNGFELQQLIKEEFQLPVIIMSEDKRKSIITKCLGNGATYYLVKPVSAADVKDVWQYAVAAREGKAIEVVNSAVSSTGSKKTIEDISSNSLSSVTGPEQKRKTNKRKESEMIKEDQLYGERPPAPKKTKVNWTAYLENLFLMAITQIGLDKAVPKKILEIMDVPDLTRENVASHLQKYRIFLRRVSNLGALEGTSERILKSKFAATLPSVVINEIRKRLAQTKKSSTQKSGTRGTVSGTLNPSNTTTRLQASKNTSMPQVLSTQLSNASYRVLNLENQLAQSLNQVRLGGQSLLGSNHTSNYQQPIMSGCPSAPLYQPNYLYNDGSRFSAYNGSMGSHGSINAANNGLMGGNYGTNYSSPIYNYGSLGNQNGSFNYAPSIGNQLGSFGSSNLPLSSTYYPTNNSKYSGIQFNGGESINLAGMDQAGFTAPASGIGSASVLSGAMNATHPLSGLGNAGHEPQCTSNSASQAQPDQFDDDLAELFLNMDNFPDEPQGGEALDPGCFFDFTNQNVESPKPQGLGHMITPPSESNMLQPNELPTLSNEDPNQLQLQGSHGFQDSDPIGMYLVEDAAPAANNSATYQDYDVDLDEAVFGTDKPN